MMNLSEHERKTFDEFLLSIDPVHLGYKHASFSYIAIRQDGDFILSQGRLHLLGVPLQSPTGYFESQNVRAGNFSLNELNQKPKEFLELLLSGKLTTPHGEVKFVANTNQNSSYSLFFNRFHTDGIQSQRRQMQLVITGGDAPHLNSVNIDWELKAAKTPYDSVQELCNEYAVGSFSGHQAKVEVAAYNLAVIEANSVVRESKAHLAMILTDGLDQSKASIGYRMFDKHKVTKRGQIPSTKLIWSKIDIGQCGSIEIDVPKGAVLQCFANYAEEAHHYFWVRDPSTVQNPRRAVHQVFDEKMEILHELLKSQGKGRDARDFESAIAWILWMLGFNVTHLGGTPRTSEALDLIATTPHGHFLVIECTTGILKADKLATLIDRAEKVRQSLINSGNGHLRVLPVIVTNKTREEVKVDAEQAEISGIFVGTREGFTELINLTNIAPDPDQLFKQAEDKIQRIQSPNPLIGNKYT
jgi:hypothetical protein